MTYAASLRLASLASQHTLTENELLAALRTTRAQHPGEAVSLAAIERAVLVTTRKDIPEWQNK